LLLTVSCFDSAAIERTVTADVRVAPQFEMQLRTALAHNGIDYSVRKL
jgi:hypothetical protein